MKTAKILKLGLGFMLVATLGLISFKSFAQANQKQQQNPNVNVDITIDSKTTADELKDVKNMLKEHGITATFSDISRNDTGEITGLKVQLDDHEGGQATSAISSSAPISQLTFGRKNGLLFISQNNNGTNAFAFFNRPNMMFQFDQDSIPGQSFGGFNFDDFFNNQGQGNSFFFNGKAMSIDELKEQMQKQFGNFINDDENDNVIAPKSDDSQQTTQKYRFIDNLNSHKLIMINGKEANFKTLDQLAKADKLDAVDVLKPETAISIYGNKAKDGAIIATTKH
ncbi:MAG: hypothetical protein R2812_07770 [Gelidibacter sp.]